MATSSTSSASHARFLRGLIERDRVRARQMERDRLENVAIDPVLQSDHNKYRSSASRTSQGPIANGLNHSNLQAAHTQLYQHAPTGGLPADSSFRYGHYVSNENSVPEQNRAHPMHVANSVNSAMDDFQYHRNIWRELEYPMQSFDPSFVRDMDYSCNSQSYLTFGNGN